MMCTIGAHPYCRQKDLWLHLSTDHIRSYIPIYIFPPSLLRAVGLWTHSTWALHECYSPGHSLHECSSCWHRLHDLLVSAQSCSDTETTRANYHHTAITNQRPLSRNPTRHNHRHFLYSLLCVIKVNPDMCQQPKAITETRKKRF